MQEFSWCGNKHYKVTLTYVLLQGILSRLSGQLVVGGLASVFSRGHRRQGGVSGGLALAQPCTHDSEKWIRKVSGHCRPGGTHGHSNRLAR